VGSLWESPEEEDRFFRIKYTLIEKRIFVSGRIKGETCRFFVEYIWFLMSRKHIHDRSSLWKRNFKSSKLIKPQFADWRGSIKTYLN
jgi:hypothetical protein